MLEARVIDLRHLLAILPNNVADISLMTYVQEHIADFIHILSNCVVLPNGESINDLSVSESETILLAWWKLHQDFFTRALAALDLQVETAPTSASLNPSMNPLPDSQNAGI